MAISVVGAPSSSATTTVTPATHAVGDYIVIVAMRSTITAPTLPAGFTSIVTGSGNSNSYRVGYKIATSTTDTSGTWTNASLLLCTVYTGVAGIGASTAATKAAATTATISSITPQNPNGKSWVVAFAGHAATSTQGTPLTGATTSRVTQTSGTYNAGMFDTNAGVASFAATTSSNTTSVVSSGGAIELLDNDVVGGLTDAFTAGSLNSSKWVQFTNGSATMSYSAAGASSNMPASATSTSDADLTSKVPYSLIGSSLYMQVTTVFNTATAADATFGMRDTASLNYVIWQVEAGTLYAHRIVGGVQTNIFNVLYNATTHAWWSIREGSGNGLSGSTGTTYWDTSTDGLSWTNNASFANPIVETNLVVLLSGNCFQVETNANSFVWKNFNTSPTPAAPSTGATLLMMGI